MAEGIVRRYELRVSLAKVFNNKTRCAVARDEDACYEAAGFERATREGEIEQNEAEERAFKRGLVELRGMARELGACVEPFACFFTTLQNRIVTHGREFHRPWYIRGPAPELGVDKIGQSPEHEAPRHAESDCVGGGDLADAIAHTPDP